MIAHLLFIAITFSSFHINKAERELAQPSLVWAGGALSGLLWEALRSQHRQDAWTLPWILYLQALLESSWNRSGDLGLRANLHMDSLLFPLTWGWKERGCCVSQPQVWIPAVLFTSRWPHASDLASLSLGFLICKVRLWLPASEPALYDLRDARTQ